MTETYKFPGATVRVHYGKRTEAERKEAIEEAVKRLFTAEVHRKVMICEGTA